MSSASLRRRRSGSSSFHRGRPFLKHPLADPPLRRGEGVEDPSATSPMRAPRRAALDLSSVIGRAARRIHFSVACPTSPQGELQQRQSVREAGGLARELVNQGYGKSEGQPLGRFRMARLISSKPIAER